MSELRPCQRCKEALRLSVQTNHEFYGADESLYFFVLCSACGHSSHSEYSREEAIKDWNTRPIEDAQVAEIERLKADNARMREMVRRIDDYAEEAIIDSYKRTEKQAHHDLRRFAQSTRQRCEHALKGGE